MTPDQYLTILNDAAHHNDAIPWDSIGQQPSIVASCANHPLSEPPLLSAAVAAAIERLLQGGTLKP